MSFYVPGFDSDSQMIITKCRWTYETSDGSLSSVLDLRPPSGRPVNLHKVSQTLIASWVAEQLPYTEKELQEQIKYNKTCNDAKKAATAYEVGPYLATASDFFFVTEENAKKAKEVDDETKEAAKAKAEVAIAVAQAKVEAAKEAAKEKVEAAKEAAKEKAKETVKKVAEKVKEVVDKNKPIVPIPAPEDDPVLK